MINKNMFRFLNLKEKFRDFILDFHPLPHKRQTEKGWPTFPITQLTPFFFI